MVNLLPEEVAALTAEEILAKWDANETLWSVELGGLGPGYEQAIQAGAMEALRWLLAKQILVGVSTWVVTGDALDAALVAGEIKDFDHSGATWGQAKWIALHIKAGDWGLCLHMAKQREQLIQVSKRFAGA